MAISSSPISASLQITGYSADNVSRPVRLALEAGLFHQQTSFLDSSRQGVERIAELAAGWNSDTCCTGWDIVNLGYEISQIEASEERRQILLQAWELTRQILIVAAPARIDGRDSDQIAYPDTIVRGKGFQKYYEQEELKTYIDGVLQVDSVPAALGVFFVFREEHQRENFLASCFRSVPRRPEDLLIYLACRGTALPCPQVLEIQNEINNLFGSYDRACEAVGEMLSLLKQPSAIASRSQQSQIGKLLPGALYIHVSALSEIDPLLRLYEAYGSRKFRRIDGATLIKFNIEKPKISYLFYPDFDTDPHPALQVSIQLNWQNGSLSYRDYTSSNNPPVLHRKETFIAPNDPRYEKFAALTRQEEELGLLDSSRAIGTRHGWWQCLEEHGVEIHGHQVVRVSPVGTLRPRSLPRIPKIERHRAAIVRTSLSRPVRLALEAGLLSQDTTFFDYGCGHGGDIIRMAEQGYASAGWDPYYSSETPLIPADIVNLGYVINVIEDVDERREALVKAWELTRQVLIVAALVLIEHRDTGQVAYGDGAITRRHTFQKHYEQEELKTYIDQALNVDAVPVALGIYFVFRDEAQAEAFRASRFRSRTTTPRVRHPIKRFEDYQELLAPLMAFVTDRGRLPVPGEIPDEPALKAEFGNLRRAFQVILQATDIQEWDAISDKRRQDLLVYFALSQFGRRPKLSNLTLQVQNDIKALFGSYKQACTLADLMLFSLRQPDLIANSCQNSKIGRKLPNSLLVHVRYLDALDPMLRLYEGCANRTIGRLEGATLIKFHTKLPKISYLFYPDFDTEPHPILHTSMHIDLRNLHVSYQDYDVSDNPPILHRKDAVVNSEYPGYEKFAKLTKQEEDWGLLDDYRAIETLKGWQQCLENHCAELQGYRIYWRKDADPYKVKLMQSARRARKRNSSVTANAEL